jgi:galactose oxidase
LQHEDGQLLLAASAIRPAVALLPLRPTDKLQWSHTTQSRKPLQASEASAYQRLADEHRQSPRPRRLTVTGPLVQTREGYQLRVRVIERPQTAQQ